MRILRLRAARGWTVAQTAERFLLTEMTIMNWMRVSTREARLPW